MTPDAETTAVAWAKADAPLTAIFGGRVATRLPKPGKKPEAVRWQSPFLRVVTIDADGLVAESADMLLAFLQWDVYAWKGFQPSPDWATASLGARTLATQLAAVRGVNLAGQGYISDFSDLSGPRRVEEQTGWARFRLDCLMAVSPAS